MTAPPLDLPCDGPVTYPGDIKTLRIPSKGRSGPTCIREKNRSREYSKGNKTVPRKVATTHRGWTQTGYLNKHYNINLKDEDT